MERFECLKSINRDLFKRQCEKYEQKTGETVNRDKLFKSLCRFEDKRCYLYDDFDIQSIMNNDEKLDVKMNEFGLGSDTIEDILVYKRIYDCWNKRTRWNVNTVIGTLKGFGINSYKDMQDTFWENEEKKLDNIKEFLGDDSYLKLKKYLLKDLCDYRHEDLPQPDPIIEYRENHSCSTFRPIDGPNQRIIRFDRLQDILYLSKLKDGKELLSAKMRISEHETEFFFRVLGGVPITSIFALDVPIETIEFKHLSGEIEHFDNVDPRCSGWHRQILDGILHDRSF